MENENKGLYSIENKEINSFITTLEKFKDFKREFDILNCYDERLNFWKKNSLKGLVCRVDYANLCLNIWCGKIDNLISEGIKSKKTYFIDNPKFLSENIEIYNDYISIIPTSPEETKMLFNFIYDISQSNLDTDYVKMISDYWERIGKSPMPKEYLLDRYKEVEKFTDKYYKVMSNTLAIIFTDTNKTGFHFFVIGYKQTIKGEIEINFDNFFKEVYFKDAKTSTIAYTNPFLAFDYFMYGRAMAYFRGFLSEQIERLERKENIQIKQINVCDDISVDSENKSNTKLQWNTYNRVLYDLLVQLSLQPNNKGGVVITNTLGSLARFISDNIEGMPSADVVQRELEKIREGSGIPQRGRILLKIADNQDDK